MLSEILLQHGDALSPEEKMFAEKMLAANSMLDVLLNNGIFENKIEELPTIFSQMFGEGVLDVYIGINTYTGTGHESFASQEFPPDQIEIFNRALNRIESYPDIEAASIPTKNRPRGIIALKSNIDIQTKVEIDGNLIKIEHILPFLTAMTGAYITRKNAERVGVSKNECDNLALESLLNSLEMHDQESKDHSDRVAQHTKIFAFLSGIHYPDELTKIENSTKAHDIGKLGVPGSIIRSFNKLSRIEYVLMKTHTKLGLRIIEALQLKNLDKEIIKSHHENYDGTGYPDGIKGKNIPKVARITRIIDTLDALVSSKRNYNKSYTLDEAIAIMTSQPQIYDPEILEQVIEFISSDKNIMENWFKQDTLNQEKENKGKKEV